jgi:anaerobic selenocysteine-containing dehydrogenase
MKEFTERLGRLIRQKDGPQTQDLVLHPGKFGLGQIPARLEPDDTTTLVCGFCSTGCGLKAHLRKGEAINLSADPDYPVNLGMACPKGWEALTPLRANDRATTPLLRDRRSGRLEPIDWERALILFCERLKELKHRYGPESVAFLSTGQIVTEEMALLGALFKFGMGFLHCDSNTRQCMATSHVAYKQSFGFDAPPYTYLDFEQSDVLVFVGANPCIAHPIMWQRVMQNPRNPRIIVIDPRKTETAMAATVHLPIQPKSDLMLLYGLAKILIDQGWIDRPYIDSHTEGFDEFASFLRSLSLAQVATVAGISVAQINRLAELIHSGQRVSFWWTMGVNQGHEATRTAQAIINLALMTGNIGRPGTGANSITGQCNAMGSRLFANVTSLLGGRDFANPQDRTRIARLLQIEEGAIPRENSWPYDRIIRGIKERKIKALWVIATNSAHSWVDHDDLKRALRGLDFLVVQDMFTTTETGQLADLILPAAGWGEKEGTFINSERRIGLVKKIARAPGLALSDFHILRLIAHYWGCGAQFARWSSPEAVFELLKEASRNQPCDISGIQSYGHLDRSGGIQWPYRLEERLGNNERRLFADGKFFTASGRARFLFAEPVSPPESPNTDFPFWLLSGRGTSSQWHTQSRTAKSDVLRKLYPEQIYVEVNPADAKRIGIDSGDQVTVSTGRGLLIATAFVASTVAPGSIFLPMHYPEVNRLTIAAFDPHSGQPSYKACAAKLEVLTPRR